MSEYRIGPSPLFRARTGSPSASLPGFIVDAFRPLPVPDGWWPVLRVSLLRVALIAALGGAIVTVGAIFLLAGDSTQGTAAAIAGVSAAGTTVGIVLALRSARLARTQAESEKLATLMVMDSASETTRRSYAEIARLAMRDVVRYQGGRSYSVIKVQSVNVDDVAANPSARNHHIIVMRVDRGPTQQVEFEVRYERQADQFSELSPPHESTETSGSSSPRTRRR